MKLSWNNIQEQQSHKYVCGHCRQPLASEKGWKAADAATGSGSTVARIYICHNCTKPTFFDLKANRQIPGVSFGKPVQNVTDQSLAQIYEEARAATSAGCYTASVLCCRKLLMHLAVANGAKTGDTFKNYVDFLANNNHVPAACRGWVGQIRDAGNEANHEIKMMTRDDAEHLVSFCEMLLKITYEFPAIASARSIPKAVAAIAS